MRALQAVQRDIDRCKTVAEVMDVVEDWRILSQSGTVRTDRLPIADAAKQLQAEYVAGKPGGGQGSGFRAGDFWFSSAALRAAGYSHGKPSADGSSMLLYRSPTAADAEKHQIGVGVADYSRDSWFRRTWEINRDVLGSKFSNIVRGYGKSTRPTFHTTEHRAAKKAEADDDWTGLIKTTTARKPPAKAPIQRLGRDYEPKRVGGTEVPLGTTGDYLLDTFGLRGLEHGNWVNDDARAAHIKAAGEALHDLADVLGVEPKALAHGGRLALAIGARGKGKALAHYEPGRVVINLTKTSGAGSLAHEFGHFLDHAITFLPSEGVGDNRHGTSSGDPRLDRESGPYLSDRHRQQHLQPPVVHAMHEVMDAIKHGVYDPEFSRLRRAHTEAVNERKRAHDGMTAAKRAADAAGLMFHYGTPQHTEHSQRVKQTADAARDAQRALMDHMREKGIPSNGSKYLADARTLGSYWQRDHELFARAFETWVRSRLADKGRVNDYLTADEKATAPVERQRDGKTVLVSPYPEGKEEQHIHAAIDNFVATLRSTGALRKALGLRARRPILVLFQKARMPADPRQLGLFGMLSAPDGAGGGGRQPQQQAQPQQQQPAQAKAPDAPVVGGAGGTQNVVVHQHLRRTEHGAVASVRQHMARRAKAAAQAETPASETDEQRAARMRAERAARDVEGERKRQAWKQEMAEKLAGTKDDVDGHVMGQAEAEAEADYRSRQMRFRHDYDVAEDKLPALRDRIEALNKRAAKIGAPPILLEISPEPKQHKAWIIYTPSGRSVRHTPPRFDIEAAEVVWNTYHVHIEGEPPKLPGFTFLAKIEHQPGGNMIKGMHPKCGSVPTEFLRAGRDCEHCGYERDRKHTYLVLDEGKHEVRQVGRSCLKDYTGHTNPERYADAAEWTALLDFGDDFDDSGDRGDDALLQRDPSSLGVSVDFYLRHAAEAFIRDGGYVSRKMADIRNVMSTAEHADKRAFPGKKESPKPVSEAARDLATKVAAWGKKLVEEQDANPTPGYRWNLSVLFRQGFASANNRGMLASAIAGWQRDSGEQSYQRVKPAAESQHIGTVGEKLANVDLTLEKIIPYESQFGSGVIYKFHDPDGNRVKWSTSSTPDVESDPRQVLQVGKTYRASGTVKKHDSYQGNKETALTRVAVHSRADGIYHDQHTGIVFNAADHQELREGFTHYAEHGKHPEAKRAALQLRHDIGWSPVRGGDIAEHDQRPRVVEAGRGKVHLYLAGPDHAQHKSEENPRYNSNEHLLRAVEHLRDHKDAPGHAVAKKIAPLLRDAVINYQRAINVPLSDDIAPPLRKGTTTVKAHMSRTASGAVVNVKQHQRRVEQAHAVARGVQPDHAAMLDAYTRLWKIDPAQAAGAVSHALAANFPGEADVGDPTNPNALTFRHPSYVGRAIKRAPEAWHRAIQALPDHWDHGGATWKAEHERAQATRDQEAAYEKLGADASSGPDPSKLRGRRVWLYHGTTDKFIDGIRRDGLLPGRRVGHKSNVGSKSNLDKWQDHVLLTGDSSSAPGGAANYARLAAQRHGGNPVVLRTLVDGSRLSRDRDDADLATGRHQYRIDAVAPHEIAEIDGERHAAFQSPLEKAHSRSALLTRLPVPKVGRALGSQDPPERRAVPPTRRVRYRHTSTGEERFADVVAGGDKGITVVDSETGEQVRLHHGHYTAHDDDDDHDESAGEADAT